MQAMGLDLKMEQQHVCHYTQGPACMMHTVYTCAFFVATVPAPPV
jgi:hypothetical protein